MFRERLEMDHLVLKRFCRENVDVFALYDLFGESSDDSTHVFEYVPQNPYQTIKEADDRLKTAETAWNEGEMVMYAVYPRDGSLVGYAVLSIEWERRTGHLGFILDESYWGHGYAGECAMVLTELAFDSLDLDLVVIGCEEGNKKSKRAIEKYVDSSGGQYDGLFRKWTPIGDDVADHHHYTVTREQYRKAIE